MWPRFHLKQNLRKKIIKMVSLVSNNFLVFLILSSLLQMQFWLIKKNTDFSKNGVGKYQCKILT